MVPMPRLGELIRKRRTELGLKVYELADKAGVNPVYITQIEKHGKLPSDAVFSKIEKVLGTNYYPFYIKEKYPGIAKRLKLK